MPRRIQRKRTAGWRMPEGAVYVGRPSRWANPYALKRLFSRDDPLRPYLDAAVGNVLGLDTRISDAYSLLPPAVPSVAVEAYWLYVKANPYQMLEMGRQLEGRDLACWCAILSDGAYVPCHADVQLSIVNKVPLEDVIAANTARAKDGA